MIARADALSLELARPIMPGFEALVFKASRGIEDIYELTYIRKDGSRFPAIVSVTALRDDQDAIIGYLLIGTDNTARKQVEADQQQLDQRLRDQQFYARSLIESNIDALMTTAELHDTPADNLFDRFTRNFSHGCVRVERPAELAAYLLRDQPEWTAERIETAMHAEKEKHVALKSPVPVHMVYWTAWVDSAGVLQIRPDVYGYGYPARAADLKS